MILRRKKELVLGRERPKQTWSMVLRSLKRKRESAIQEGAESTEKNMGSSSVSFEVCLEKKTLSRGVADAF
jgi:hypothetical protein